MATQEYVASHFKKGAIIHATTKSTPHIMPIYTTLYVLTQPTQDNKSSMTYSKHADLKPIWSDTWNGHHQSKQPN